MATPESAFAALVFNRLAKLERQGKLIFWRQNNGAVFDARRGIYRKPPPGHRPGVPDCMVILTGGRALGLEFKAASGGASAAQQRFAVDMARMGAHYFVIKTEAELQAALEAAGA